MFINKYLNEIYIRNEAAIGEAFTRCEVNLKLFVAAFLVNRDARKYTELRKWTEKVAQNSLHVLFGKPQQDEAVEMAVKYLNGGLFIRDSLVTDILKKVNTKDMDAGILQLLSGTGLIEFEHSNILKRFIKMLILLNYNAAFDALYNVMKSEAYGEGPKLINIDLQSIITQLGISEELLIAWMGNRCAQNEDEFRDVLVEKIGKNRNVFKKAADLTDGWGSAYLNRLLLENESDDEGLKLMEDSLMEVMEKFFIDLNVPKPVYTDYLEYLRGTKPVSVIMDSINKLFTRQSIHYYYYENIFKKLSWFKKISPVYLRCICFFMYSGNFAIVTRIIETISMSL